MRISDWSSDVCSSDLLSRFPRTMTPVVQFVFIVMRLLPLLRRADRAPLLLQARISVLWRNLALSKRLQLKPDWVQNILAEEGRVGKVGVRSWRTRWSSYKENKNNEE